jgi:hypothetical protein
MYSLMRSIILLSLVLIIVGLALAGFAVFSK